MEGRTPLPLVRLSAASTAPCATADLRLSIGGEPFHFALTVPTGPARMRDLLPIFRGLAEAVVGVAVREVEKQGKTISCCKGCGACCRQMVPISESEAWALARLVDAMPEPRRSIVRARFAEARRRLDVAGLPEQLAAVPGASGEELRPLGLAYFRLGVACPFLEDESCSIHPDRPVACREYLVTSPAEECARPTPESVRTVPMPAAVGSAVRTLDKQASGGRSGWMPLTFALEWAAAHPDEPASRPGTVLVQEFFKRLTGKTVPDVAAPGGGPPS
jgi:Fe-S-cluster containining protein